MSAPRLLVGVVASAALIIAASQRPPAAGEPIAIVTLNSDIGSPDGTFSYNYETANGITAEVRGSQKDSETQSVQGSFSFTADDGQKYSVSYTADEGGFLAKGDHLPTQPPIPPEIQRSLEFNAKNPEPEDGPPAKG